MTAKQPFMPLFFGDLLASTSEWKGEEVSLYVTLLGHQWVLGSLPNDAAALAQLVRWDRRSFNRCWTQVQHKFSTSPAHLEQKPGGIGGRLCNIRLEEHRAKSKELSAKNAESGKRGAAKRWGGDSERHESASGENVAGATKAPVPSANGATHSNPSHPIPSEDNPPTPLERGAGSLTRPGTDRKPRDVRTASNAAWGLVVEGAARAYERQRIEAEDPVLATAVQKIGGWNRFGQSSAIGTLKSSFRELYEQFAMQATA